MSVRGFLRDVMLLNIISALVLIAVFTFYVYFTTNDANYLVWGLIVAFLAVLGGLARYTFLVSYLWTLWKRWCNRND